ncbi:hypothetical protein SAMN05216524_106327 [Mucilaginibacter sp. OK098]|nr:hypothetical protein SAMN05216524_106327 [Mucilaginibacter sp. OK098]
MQPLLVTTPPLFRKVKRRLSVVRVLPRRRKRREFMELLQIDEQVLPLLASNTQLYRNPPIGKGFNHYNNLPNIYGDNINKSEDIGLLNR